MTDIFAYAGEVQPNDIKASDPTVLNGGELTHYTLDAEAGVFTLTGTAATLKTGRLVSAAAGAYAASGTAATLKVGYVLAAAAGTYSVTGTAATLKTGHVLAVTAGSYAVSGTAATLTVGHRLVAASGSFSLTGSAATLTHGNFYGTLFTAPIVPRPGRHRSRARLRAYLRRHPLQEAA